MKEQNSSSSSKSPQQKQPAAAAAAVGPSNFRLNPSAKEFVPKQEVPPSMHESTANRHCSGQSISSSVFSAIHDYNQQQYCGQNARNNNNSSNNTTSVPPMQELNQHNNCGRGVNESSSGVPSLHELNQQNCGHGVDVDNSSGGVPSMHDCNQQQHCSRYRVDDGSGSRVLSSHELNQQYCRDGVNESYSGVPVMNDFYQQYCGHGEDYQSSSVHAVNSWRRDHGVYREPAALAGEDTVSRNDHYQFEGWRAPPPPPPPPVPASMMMMHHHHHHHERTWHVPTNYLGTAADGTLPHGFPPFHHHHHHHHHHGPSGERHAHAAFMTDDFCIPPSPPRTPPPVQHLHCPPTPPPPQQYSVPPPIGDYHPLMATTRFQAAVASVSVSTAMNEATPPAQETELPVLQDYCDGSTEHSACTSPALDEEEQQSSEDDDDDDNDYDSSEDQSDEDEDSDYDSLPPLVSRPWDSSVEDGLDDDDWSWNSSEDWEQSISLARFLDPRLSEAEVLALPEIEFSKGEDDRKGENNDGRGGDAPSRCCNDSCPICLEDFVQGEKLRLLPKCSHAFHTDHILTWLTQVRGCCPLCKTRVDSTAAAGRDQGIIDTRTYEVDAAFDGLASLFASFRRISLERLHANNNIARHRHGDLVTVFSYSRETWEPRTRLPDPPSANGASQMAHQQQVEPYYYNHNNNREGMLFDQAGTLRGQDDGVRRRQQQEQEQQQQQQQRQERRIDRNRQRHDYDSRRRQRPAQRRFQRRSR